MRSRADKHEGKVKEEATTPVFVSARPARTPAMRVRGQETVGMGWDGTSAGEETGDCCEVSCTIGSVAWVTLCCTTSCDFNGTTGMGSCDCNGGGGNEVRNVPCSAE